MKPSASLLLRQLMSLDSPKVQVSLGVEEDKRKTKPHLLILNEQQRHGMLPSSCFICTSTHLPRPPEGIHICLSEDTLRSVLGTHHEEDEVLGFCSVCLPTVKRLVRLTEEVQDLKVRIQAVIRLKRQFEEAESSSLSSSRDDDGPQQPEDEEGGFGNDDMHPESSSPIPPFFCKNEDEEEEEEQQGLAVEEEDDPLSMDPLSFPLEGAVELELEHPNKELTHNNPISGKSQQLPRRKALVCPTCNQTFYNPLLFQAHTHPDDPTAKGPFYTCPFCPQHQSYKNKGSFENHMRRSHIKFQCYFCPKKISSMVALIAHMRHHTRERHFRCQKCHHSFLAGTALWRHTRRLCGDKERREKVRKTQREARRRYTAALPHPCDACDLRFRYKITLARHKAREHSDVEIRNAENIPNVPGPPLKTSPHRKYMCPICKRAYNRQDVFKAHTHPDPSDPRKIVYNCGQCDQVLATPRSLTDHLNNIHRGLLVVQCDGCGKVLTRKNNLRAHKASFCPASSKKETSFYQSKRGEFKCYFCGRLYSSKATIMMHTTMLHTKERHFYCVKCGVRFDTGNKYRRHLLRACASEELRDKMLAQNKEYRRRLTANAKKKRRISGSQGHLL